MLIDGSRKLAKYLLIAACKCINSGWCLWGALTELWPGKITEGKGMQFEKPLPYT
jgi:hypothetical protein